MKVGSTCDSQGLSAQQPNLGFNVEDIETGSREIYCKELGIFPEAQCLLCWNGQCRCYQIHHKKYPRAAVWSPLLWCFIVNTSIRQHSKKTSSGAHWTGFYHLPLFSFRELYCQLDRVSARRYHNTGKATSWFAQLLLSLDFTKKAKTSWLIRS